MKPSIRCFTEVAKVVNDKAAMFIDPETGAVSRNNMKRMTPSEYFNALRDKVNQYDESCNRWILTAAGEWGVGRRQV